MSGLESPEFAALRRLAREHRVLTRYRDGFGRFRSPTPEALLAVLGGLGVPITRAADAGEALLAVRGGRWSSIAPPCAVVWQDAAAWVELRFAKEAASGFASCRLLLESGEVREWRTTAAELPVRGECVIGGERFRSTRLALPSPLPPGYHRLLIELGGRRAECVVIAAPRRCFQAEGNDRGWGVFLPLYALHTEQGDGAGDLSLLGELSAWTRSLGGSVVGTLPLLAAYLDEPFEYSPYVPVSRLFWNEFYVDPRRTPEWERSPEARSAYEQAKGEREELRAAPLIDYRRTAALRRRVLARLAEQAWSDPERAGELRAWIGERPEPRAYARFRATVEKRRETWRNWPERMRAGQLEPGDWETADERYHLYAQWTAERQLDELGPLYLDLPLGTHPGGFDVWRQPAAFAEGVSGGAPPDRFFIHGQDWSFSPLHPETVRRDGHAHLRACLRHHLRRSAILRIDHFMGLHRLYWIPRGASAAEGTYVQYPAEELYAVVCLESTRARARVVGEDLGTVPEYVRRRMREHAIDRMYVAQFSFKPNSEDVIEEPPADSLASVNTHDTPMFAAFWEGLDIDLRVELGLLTEAEAEEARRARAEARERIAATLGTAADRDAVLRALLERLARSPARTVMVSLEDLWGETEPQNTPGSGQERPNWRRRARLTLDEMKKSESAGSAGRLRR